MANYIKGSEISSLDALAGIHDHVFYDWGECANGTVRGIELMDDTFLRVIGDWNFRKIISEVHGGKFFYAIEEFAPMFREGQRVRLLHDIKVGHVRAKAGSFGTVMADQLEYHGGQEDKEAAGIYDATHNMWQRMSLVHVRFDNGFAQYVPDFAIKDESYVTPVFHKYDRIRYIGEDIALRGETGRVAGDFETPVGILCSFYMPKATKVCVPKEYLEVIKDA